MKPRHILYAVLATVVIFAAGVITGGTLVRKTSIKPPVAPPPQGFQMARLNQFQLAVNRLNLEPDQRQRINRLIRERQDYIAEIMRIIEPDLPGVFFKLRRDINQELRVDQRQVLDEMWARVEQKKLPNRNPEFMGKPGDAPMNRPNQPFPTRPNGPRGPQPLRQSPDRPPPGEPPPPNPPPQQ